MYTRKAPGLPIDFTTAQHSCLSVGTVLTQLLDGNKWVLGFLHSKLQGKAQCTMLLFTGLPPQTNPYWSFKAYSHLQSPLPPFHSLNVLLAPSTLAVLSPELTFASGKGPGAQALSPESWTQLSQMNFDF